MPGEPSYTPINAGWQQQSANTWYATTSSASAIPINVGVTVQQDVAPEEPEEAPLDWLNRRVSEVCELVR